MFTYFFDILSSEYVFILFQKGVRVRCTYYFLTLMYAGGKYVCRKKVHVAEKYRYFSTGSMCTQYTPLKY